MTTVIFCEKVFSNYNKLFNELQCKKKMLTATRDRDLNNGAAVRTLLGVLFISTVFQFF